MECPEAALQGAINKGDRVEINLATGRIENKTNGKSFSARPVPEFLQMLFSAGGLVPYVRARMEKEQAS